MANTILIEFQQTQKHFLQALSTFTEDQFNVVPFENSWTAAQVGEHIAKSQSMAADLMYGNTKPSQRDSHQKVEAVKKIFLDFTTKLTSPEVILPSDGIRDKAIVTNNLVSIAGKIEEIINTLNLTEECTDFALPMVGELTRGEWIYFIIYHTQRHTHQLNTIFQTIVASS